MFDKTKTLTKGKPEVTDIIINSKVKNQKSKISFFDKKDLLILAASVEKNSEHPLGEAIVKMTEKRKLQLIDVKNFKSISGKGVYGEIMIGKSRFAIIAGNEKLMSDYNVLIDNKDAKSLKNQGKTIVYMAIKNLSQKESQYAQVTIFAIADTVKESAAETINLLNKNGINTFMVTGDNEETAQTIGKKLGLKKENIFAEVLPEQKENIVKSLKKNVNGVVAFVGDGVNDAPALASADVGIAIGTGSDVAIETASITLVNKNLETVLGSIELSKKTMKTIRLNLFWAFAYNAVLVPVAIFGKVSPILASAAMAFSSISVVGNSLLLKKAKI